MFSGHRGQFARELGRLASKCGELGALPEHPAASRPLRPPWPSDQRPWAPPALGGGTAASSPPVLFGFLTSVFRSKLLPYRCLVGGRAKGNEIFECCWFCFLRSVSFLL